MDPEVKRQRDAQTRFRMINFLKQFDLFGYEPAPQHVGGAVVSSWGFAGSFFLVVLVIVYLSVSLNRFLNQHPSVSVTTLYESQQGALMPLRVSLQNPELARRPGTRRPALTTDLSYFSVAAVITKAQHGQYDSTNTVPLTMQVCQSEWHDERRNSFVTGYCPQNAEGKCSPTVLCFDPSSAPPTALLSGNCAVSPTCSRIEISVSTCAEPAPWLEMFLNYTIYTYPVIPIPSLPNPLGCNAQLTNAISYTPPLVDSSGSYGMVQVRPTPQSPWGFICNDGFDANETKVMCETLGLPSTFAWQLSPTSGLYHDMGPGSHYYLDNNDCPNASATNFFEQCGFLFYPYNVTDTDCGYNEAVGIYCGDRRPYSFEFKLVNSSNPQMGLLIVRPKGTTQWATVMNDNFTEADAMAACRSLGYNVTAARILPQGIFGYGAAYRYFLYHSRCSFTTSEGLDECADVLYADFRQKLINKEVSLDCSYEFHELKWQYKLIDGYNASHDTTVTGKGMVLIRPNSTAPWGGICGFSWNGMAAGALCRAIGFHVPSARVLRPLYSSSMYTPSNIYLENMDCRDSSGILEDCNYTFFPPGSPMGSHSFDCGKSNAARSSDIELAHVSLFGWVDCNFQCATPDDIMSTAVGSGLQMNVSLSLKGMPAPAVAFSSISVELQRQTSLLLTPYITNKNPDLFSRFTTTSATDLILESLSASTIHVYLTPFAVLNNTASLLLQTSILQMGSHVATENQNYQNSFDMLGSIYAFYGSLVGGFGLLCLTFNRRKFFRKNPQWSRITSEFQVAPAPPAPPLEEDGVGIVVEEGRDVPMIERKLEQNYR